MTDRRSAMLEPRPVTTPRPTRDSAAPPTAGSDEAATWETDATPRAASSSASPAASDLDRASLAPPRSEPIPYEGPSPDAIRSEPTRFEPTRSGQTRLDQARSDQSRPAPSSRRRSVLRPIVLFGLTCGTTFLAGASGFSPWPSALASTLAGDAFELRQLILIAWPQGIAYAAALMAILLSHELGHFFAAAWYRIPASLPHFLPVPNLTGTMGAVIRMDGLKADRRQIFDIGLAGPLAGLVVIVPVLLLAVSEFSWEPPPPESLVLDCPLLLRAAVAYLRPDLEGFDGRIALDSVDPWMMAAWTGLLVTGLNMVPLGQLDGGHVMHALLLKRARRVAEAILAVAVLALIYYGVVEWTLMPWFLMLILILVTGLHHPPTRNDAVPLGWVRWTVGVASLTIPILCFPLRMVYLMPVS